MQFIREKGDKWINIVIDYYERFSPPVPPHPAPHLPPPPHLTSLFLEVDLERTLGKADEAEKNIQDLEDELKVHDATGIKRLDRFLGPCYECNYYAVLTSRSGVELPLIFKIFFSLFLTKVVGQNMKTLELSETEALNREEKYEETIRSTTGSLKVRH